jgi:hypothetical protein
MPEHTEALPTQEELTTKFDGMVAQFVIYGSACCVPAGQDDIEVPE